MQQKKLSVLIADGTGMLEKTFKPLLTSRSVEVTVVSDIMKAKTKLIESAPKLIICSFSFDGDREAGVRFSNDLRGHPSLSTIPVMLVDEKLQSDDIEKAKGAGAKAIVSIPVDESGLIKGLSKFLPGVFVSGTQAPQVSVSFEEKLEYAEQLLAKVVNNLKTSHLLQVVDKEDVPRVVSEITRKVCGIDAAPAEVHASKPVSSKAGDTSVDLAQAFGMKK